MKTAYYRDRVIWITGASSGIGEACAREFVARGAKVAVSARNADSLAALARELDNTRVLPLPLDVTQPEAMHNAVEIIQKHFGGLDTAFFNAGTWEPTEIVHFDSGNFEKTMAVNFLGMVNGIEAVLPVLKASTRPHLVGMSSAVAFRGIPRAEAYCASKAAVRSMLQALRCSLHPLGIPVTCVLPGFVKSPLTDKNDFHMPFLMETGDAAERIADGIASHKNEIRFPKPLILMMRIMALLPDSLYTRMMAGKVYGA
jgi:NADP-dependent 3-hydroxy acid dehydrogenase YdfG